MFKVNMGLTAAFYWERGTLNSSALNSAAPLQGHQPAHLENHQAAHLVQYYYYYHCHHCPQLSKSYQP